MHTEAHQAELKSFGLLFSVFFNLNEFAVVQKLLKEDAFSRMC